MSSCPCNRRARPPLERTTEIVREVERIALDTPGIVRVAAFAGLSGATRTQASNAAALFPVSKNGGAPEEGLVSCQDHGELRRRLSALEGAFIIVIPPPSIPGIGTGGGFTHAHSGPARPRAELLAAATDELVAAARRTPGLTSVFSPSPPIRRRCSSRSTASRRRNWACRFRT